MPPSQNSQVADVLIARAVRARRVEATQRDALWARLAILEGDIVAALKATDPGERALLGARRQAVERLMALTITPLITVQYTRLAGLATAMLVPLAQQEVVAIRAILEAVTTGAILLDVPGVAGIRERVTEALLPTAVRATDLSTTGEDWWQRQGASLAQRLGDQLMVSVSLEESLTHTVARVRGTRDNAFQDGLMAKAKQDAARLLRTQVTSALTQGRMVAAEAHAERMVLEHSAIMDTKTSIICTARDGARFDVATHEPLGHSLPYLGGPPYHPGCRSQILTLLADGGPVPPENLDTWLRRQGDAFQDALLGPKRAQLFREKRLRSVRDLLDTAGRPLTLEGLGA